MDFVQLKQEIATFKFYEIRTNEDDYFEAVLANDDVSNLLSKLDSFFGIRAWPSSKELSSGIKKTIDDFGGVRKGQTLYCTDGDSTCLFAMLWPWQDKVHTTLKAGLKKE